MLVLQRYKIFCNFVGLKVLKNENKVVYSSQYHNPLQFALWLWLCCSISYVLQLPFGICTYRSISGVRFL